LLKNAALRVAVLEAGGVSHATTGHTTAKVSAQHGLIYDTLRLKFGQDGARAYAHANLAAVDIERQDVRAVFVALGTHLPRAARTSRASATAGRTACEEQPASAGQADSAIAAVDSFAATRVRGGRAPS
jgi:glycine/D-amino acid oxidase-like deaminating enzyme